MIDIEAAGEAFKDHAMKFSILISLVTLYDVFHFSNYQGQEFNDKYQEKVEGLAKGNVTAAEYIQYCKDKLGIEICLRY